MRGKVWTSNELLSSFGLLIVSQFMDQCLNIGQGCLVLLT